jgi:two-component system KDP operon response regulator KdpE
MRRVNGRLPELGAEVLKYEDLCVDFNSRTAYFNGHPLDLTPTEFGVLFHLMSNWGKVVSQEQLLTEVCGSEYRNEVHYLKVYVRRLREKLKDNPENACYIRTVRGVGYVFPAANG